MMRNRAVVLACLFAGLIFIQAAAAQEPTAFTSYPELVPLALSEKLSTMREPLPVETIVDASLAFSGATEARASSAKDKLEALLRRFREEVASTTAQAELGEKALVFLHKNLFTGYSVLQTRVDVALESGIYNCVSSAVLYMIVARSVGLSVDGVRTSDHAFASVLIDGQQVDVETTSPFGYNPGAKKEFADSFGKVTGYAYVPPGNYRDRRDVGEKELISLILHNLVAEYGNAQAYRDALQPAVNAYTLMGTEDTRQLMRVAFSNYLTWLGLHKSFPQGVQFVDVVKASFGTIVDLEQSRRNMYHDWVVTLLRASSLSDVDALLGQQAVRAALGEADWTDLSVEAVQRRALAESSADGNLAAAAVIVEGLKRLGRLPPLLQNYEAYIHTQFALLYNARKTAEARTVIDQGLAVYPDSRLFIQDLDLVRHAPKA